MTDHSAFIGNRKLAAGTLLDVALAAKPAIDRGETVFIFDGASQPVDIDFRGSAADLRARLTPPAPVEAPRGPGRPKLGVVAREITLLPRHWDWLGRQPGGASVAMRKLVEDARRLNEDKDRARAAREVAYRFMSAMAGNLANFEEATRALFASDGKRFAAMIEWWPEDIREHVEGLAADGVA